MCRASQGEPTAGKLAMYIYRIIQLFKYYAGLFARTEVCTVAPSIQPFEVPEFYGTLETPEPALGLVDVPGSRARGQSHSSLGSAAFAASFWVFEVGALEWQHHHRRRQQPRSEILACAPDQSDRPLCAPCMPAPFLRLDRISPSSRIAHLSR